MPHSPPSSNASARCRLDWRPLPVVAWGLRLLGLGAAVAPWLTALPMAVSTLLSLLVLAEGFRLAHRHARAQPVALLLDTRSGLLHVAGIAVPAFELRWRGRCVFIAWHDAADRRHRRIFWPGQLDAAQLRQLRLHRVEDPADASPAAQSVAP